MKLSHTELEVILYALVKKATMKEDEVSSLGRIRKSLLSKVRCMGGMTLPTLKKPVSRLKK